MTWSPQQARALDAAARWLERSSQPVFYLAGYAGTGKTTLAKHLAGEGALYAAFTGKAAHVMRRHGCDGATTIHSLIYLPVSRSGVALAALKRELAELLEQACPDPREEARLKAMVAREAENLKKPWFELNPESPLRHAPLLVVDECSMVDERVGEDLLSFGVPLLVLGDPAQLPPVFGAGYFTAREPDVFLTEVHRQARENPIIDMATRVREGGTLPYGAYGESSVVPRRRADPQPGVQILVGKNDTRRKANARCREGRGPLPEVGDRLVCLRNDRSTGLLNGSTWGVDELLGEGEVEGSLSMAVVGEEGEKLTVDAHSAPFLGEEVPWDVRRDAQEFDFGYALTVHKAQGSQWPEVFVLDESCVFRADAPKHLYTAITRASERVTVMR